MATALDLINDALQEIGVQGAGETASAEDAQLCLDALNGLIDSWQIENLYLYNTQDVSAALPAATSSRTIGPAMQFATTRPVRLEAGCYVTQGGLDYPLKVISREEYNAITLKTIGGGWPQYVMYDDAYPTGTVYFWPQGACTVHLNVTVQLSSFALVSTSFAMPPGYRRALALTLAEEIAAKFERPLNPTTAQKAIKARRMLKRANVVVPQLDMGVTVDGPLVEFYKG